MREAQASVQTAITRASPEVWSGKTHDAFIQEATSLASELSALATRWDAEASALSAYAQGVQGIQDQQRILELRRADAQADLDSYQRQKRAADFDTAAAAALGSPLDHSMERSSRLEGLIDDTGDDLASIERQWEILVDDRDRLDRACISALTGEDVLGSLSTSSLRGVTSGATLLSTLSATDLAVLARTNPDLFVRLLGTDPTKVHDWWTDLSEGEQSALIQAAPAIIGNLEGVAYTDRDTANRLWLDQQLAEVRMTLADAQQFGMGRGAAGGYQQESNIAATLERLRGLEGIEKALSSTSGHASRYLISLTGGGPPLGAVSIGNLDTVDSATWAVPGMGSSAAGLPDWARNAQRLQEAQGNLDPNHTHAVVAWVGYQAPAVGAPSVLGTDLATAGGANLAHALSGFNATRADASLNVVAHSYGTTTSSIALTMEGTHVDTFVSLGSAGLPSDIDQASDLHADHVYAGQAQDVMEIDPAPGDQWAWVGRTFGTHPVNPVGDTFGAEVFGVDSGSGAAVTDHGTETPDGTGYLDRDTESLRNVALATTGQGDRVSPAIDHDPTPFQQALIEGLTSAY